MSLFDFQLILIARSVSFFEEDYYITDLRFLLLQTYSRAILILIFEIRMKTFVFETYTTMKTVDMNQYAEI